jgi:ribosomal protein L9
MAELTVVRLLQNPLGAVAPPGVRGDIVRVSDGAATIYLDPNAYEQASQGELWAMLAEARRSKVTTG